MTVGYEIEIVKQNNKRTYEVYEGDSRRDDAISYAQEEYDKADVKEVNVWYYDTDANVFGRHIFGKAK